VETRLYASCAAAAVVTTVSSRALVSARGCALWNCLADVSCLRAVLSPAAVLVTEPQRIHHMYLEHFSSVMGSQPLLAESDPFAAITLHDNISALPTLNVMHEFSQEDVWQALLSSRSEIAPGPDLLRPENFRLAADIVAPLLCELFQLGFELARVAGILAVLLV